MNLRHLKDSDLLFQTKQLVQSEREILTKVLQHLREVERRRLFSDLGYQSLFEYAVKELKYGEGSAGRRIQAMRLLKELPALEKKIESGDLSLSNISQAQTYFRESQKAAPQLKIESSEKLKVLESLENKSTREGQKVLLSLQPQAPLPREQERIIDNSNSEMNFVRDEELNMLLEEVRSLLGPKSCSLSLADLIREMAKISIDALKVRKFGKRRSRDIAQGLQAKKREDSEGGTAQVFESPRDYGSTPTSKPHKRSSKKAEQLREGSEGYESGAAQGSETPRAEGSARRSRRSEENFEKDESLRKDIKEIHPVSIRSASTLLNNPNPTPAPELIGHKNARYIPRSIQHEVWNRDQGECQICGTRRNLNFDHIKPIAFGGKSSPQNLRLCCFQCNQRQAIKIFGVDHVQKYRESLNPG